MRGIPEAIAVRPGEVSKGSKRFMASHQTVEPGGGVFTKSGALPESLCYWVCYAYPLENWHGFFVELMDCCDELIPSFSSQAANHGRVKSSMKSERKRHSHHVRVRT